MAIEPAVDAHLPGAFSGAALRPDFPVFDNLTRSGKRLVYLDAAASSPKPRRVIEAMADVYGHHYANVHRGIYELSEDATARFEGARRAVARFVNAASEREIVFVRNATEAINLVAYSWGRANLRAGDRMLTTQLEHHANIVPWQQLCREVGATLDYVSITDDGRLDPDSLRDNLANGPKLVAVAASATHQHHQRAAGGGARRARAGPVSSTPPNGAAYPSTLPPSAATPGLSGRRCSARRGSARSGPPKCRRCALLTGGSRSPRPWRGRVERGPLRFRRPRRSSGIGWAASQAWHGGRAQARALPVRARLARPGRDPGRAPARPRRLRHPRRRDQLRARRNPPA
jgi:hypothetical protein